MAYSWHHPRGDARFCGALLWTFLGLRPGGIGIQRATLFPRELFFWFFFQKQLKKMAFWQNFLIIFGAFGRLSKYFAKIGK